MGQQILVLISLIGLISLLVYFLGEGDGNFANFASYGCENGGFLRHRLLAPCLRVGRECS